MTIKVLKWPKNEDVSYDELVEPVIKALKFAYGLTRKNLYKDIEYTGYDGENSLHIIPPVDTLFTAENLNGYESEHGRNALDVILGLLFRLGFDQGVRSKQKEIKILELALMQMRLQKREDCDD